MNLRDDSVGELWRQLYVYFNKFVAQFKSFLTIFNPLVVFFKYLVYQPIKWRLYKNN